MVYRDANVQSVSLDCLYFFRQLFSGYFFCMVLAFDIPVRNVFCDCSTSSHNSITSILFPSDLQMFHSIRILFL